MIEKIDARLEDICAGIGRSFNMNVNLELNQGGYWPVENNPQLTKFFINYMRQAPNVDFVETAPAMTGEDFGFLLAKFPGTMFWLGVDDDSQLHSATLTPQESAIKRGVDAITGFIEARMNKEE